jgi:hypothetical protein
MTQYLLSIYQPDGDPPAAEVLAEIARDLAVLRDELKAAGAWVFAGGLEVPGAARVIHPRRERTPMTDGPFVEAKEHIGGVNIIEAASMDEALEWGRKLARATTLPIEVRAFQGDPDEL